MIHNDGEGEGRNSGQSGFRNGLPQKARMRILFLFNRYFAIVLTWDMDSAVDSCAIIRLVEAYSKIFKRNKMAAEFLSKVAIHCHK